MAVLLSELLVLPEWSSVQASIHAEDRAVEDVVLVHGELTTYMRDVLYCLPWQTSLYNPALDIVTRRIARDNAAGIVIIRDAPSPDIPAYLLELAQRLRVNIAFCNTQDFSDVWAASKQRLVSVEFSQLREDRNIMRVLSNIVAQCPSVEEFTVRVREGLGIPIYWSAQPSSSTRSTPIKVANEIVGYLVDASDGGKVRSDLMAVLGVYSATIHLADVSRLQMKAHYHSDLLRILLDETSDIEARLAAARRAKVNLDGPTRIIVLSSRFETFYTEDLRAWDNVFIELEQVLASQNVTSLTGYFSGHPTLLVQQQTLGSSNGGHFPISSDLHAQLQNLLGRNGIMGVSSVHSLRTSSIKLFQEAVEAVTIGRALGKNETVIDYEGLGQDRLFYALLTSPFANSLARDMLEPLLERDYKQGTDYVKTVATYVLNGRKLMETARLLNLHRNSLRYRLDQIEQILGFTFGDTERVLLLQLAVLSNRIHRPVLGTVNDEEASGVTHKSGGHF